jgi:hypothetical protein
LFEDKLSVLAVEVYLAGTSPSDIDLEYVVRGGNRLTIRQANMLDSKSAATSPLDFETHLELKQTAPVSQLPGAHELDPVG